MVRLKKNKNYKQYIITKAVHIRRKNRYSDVTKVIRILNRGRIKSNFDATQMCFFLSCYYHRHDSDLLQGQFLFIIKRKIHQYQISNIELHTNNTSLVSHEMKERRKKFPTICRYRFVHSVLSIYFYWTTRTCFP